MTGNVNVTGGQTIYVVVGEGGKGGTLGTFWDNKGGTGGDHPQTECSTAGNRRGGGDGGGTGHNVAGGGLSAISTAALGSSTPAIIAIAGSGGGGANPGGGYDGGGAGGTQGYSGTGQEEIKQLLMIIQAVEDLKLLEDKVDQGPQGSGVCWWILIWWYRKWWWRRWWMVTTVVEAVVITLLIHNLKEVVQVVEDHLILVIHR